jgi:acyl-CoA synthetase (AMP-forming)/AMP-acid ligase II
VQVLGSIGDPIPDTEVKVVDSETGKAVAPGVKGLVKARGPQIMKGYFKASTLRSKSSAPSPVIDANCEHFVAWLMNHGDGHRPGGSKPLDVCINCSRPKRFVLNTSP